MKNSKVWTDLGNSGRVYFCSREEALHYLLAWLSQSAVIREKVRQVSVVLANEKNILGKKKEDEALEMLFLEQ